MSNNNTSKKKTNGSSGGGSGALMTYFSEKLTKLGKLVNRNIQNIGVIAQRQQLEEQVLERLDINIAAMTEVMREVFGRFEQFEAYLNQIAESTEWTPSDLQPETIRKQAHERFDALLEDSFRRVLEARQQRIEEERAKAEKQKQEEEAATAEKTLQQAEEGSRNIAEKPGGEGSEIPEGAEVFGD